MKLKVKTNSLHIEVIMTHEVIAKVEIKLNLQLPGNEARE